MQYNIRPYQTISHISVLFWILWGLGAFLLEELSLCPSFFFTEIAGSWWVLLKKSKRDVFKIGKSGIHFQDMLQFWSIKHIYPNWKQASSQAKSCKQQGLLGISPATPWGMVSGICICKVLKHLFGATVSHLSMVFQKWTSEPTHLRGICGIVCEQPSYELICSMCKTAWTTWYIWQCAQKHGASISRGPATLRQQRFTQEISRACSAVWRESGEQRPTPLLSSPGIALILLNQVV